jgi:hypothetical protein
MGIDSNNLIIIISFIAVSTLVQILITVYRDRYLAKYNELLHEKLLEIENDLRKVNMGVDFIGRSLPIKVEARENVSVGISSVMEKLDATGNVRIGEKDKLITRAEAARILDVSTQAIQYWHYKNTEDKLPVHKKGKKFMYLLSDVRTVKERRAARYASYQTATQSH